MAECFEKSFTRIRNNTVNRRNNNTPPVTLFVNPIQMRINPPIKITNLINERIITSRSSFFSRFL
jgi:hypothetical protein